MRISAIIPARYHSTRFPGKPLAKILGKPMIQRVYEQVVRSELFDSVWIATDNHLIFSLVKSFCSNVEMTRSDHESGTDRVWELAQNLDTDCVINVQGDEPLIEIDVLNKMVSALISGESVVSAAFLSNNFEWFSSRDHVKVVLDRSQYALYFSRASIPHSSNMGFVNFWHHVGVYGYSKKALSSFCGWEKSKLEQTENLEQLRFLENGEKVKILTTEYQGFGVDRPEDIFLVEEKLRVKGGFND